MIYIVIYTMKFIKFIVAILIIIALVFCVIKIKNSFSNIPNTKDITEWIGSLIKDINIKWIDSGAIQNSLSWKIDEAKWLAEQYYKDVLKDYVNKAKEWVSWAVESAKWYYNQWVDDLWRTITDEINARVVSWLDKIKVK